MFAFKSIASRPAMTSLVARHLSVTRAFGTERELVKLDDLGNGIFCLIMNHKPVNSFSTQHMTELVSALGEIEGNEHARAMVITSDVPKVYSAGLDIKQMYRPDVNSLDTFYTAFQDLWLRFYGTRLALVAAINGHAPAGGCMLALTCDCRIMVDSKATIGLNETQLGIVAPPFLIETMVRTVGHRQASKLLQLGKTLSPEQALAVGLVDELAPLDQVLPTAMEHAKRCASIDPSVWRETKRRMRQDLVDRQLAMREQEKKSFLDQIKDPAVQRSLGVYLEGLRTKAK